jgi:hypothetical protein
MSNPESLAEELSFEKMLFCPSCKKEVHSCECKKGEGDPLASREAQIASRDDLLTEEQYREQFGQDELDKAIAQGTQGDKE